MNNINNINFKDNKFDKNNYKLFINRKKEIEKDEKYQLISFSDNKLLINLNKLDLDKKNNIVISDKIVKINKLSINLEKNIEILEFVSKNKVKYERTLELLIEINTNFSKINFIIDDRSIVYNIDLNLNYHEENDNNIKKTNTNNELNMLCNDTNFTIKSKITCNKKSNKLIINQILISKNKINNQTNEIKVNIKSKNNIIQSDTLHIVKRANKIVNHVSIVAEKTSEDHNIDEHIRVFDVAKKGFDNFMIPEIDIRNNKGSSEHRAEIINFDEKYLFYLMSRGLSQNKAKYIILENIFSSRLKFIDISYVSNILNGLVE